MYKFILKINCGIMTLLFKMKNPKFYFFLKSPLQQKSIPLPMTISTAPATLCFSSRNVTWTSATPRARNTSDVGEPCNLKSQEFHNTLNPKVLDFKKWKYSCCITLYIHFMHSYPDIYEQKSPNPSKSSPPLPHTWEEKLIPYSSK